MVTGFIAAQNGQVISVENMTLSSTQGYNGLVFYDENFARLQHTTITAGNAGITNPSDGVYEIKISAFSVAVQVRYIRFSCADLTNAIITYKNG